MERASLTGGGIGGSLEDGSLVSEIGTGLQRLRSTTDAWSMRGASDGRVSVGVSVTGRAATGWTPLGLILRGFVFVSGTIAGDGTFTPSWAELERLDVVTRGSDGSTRTASLAWKVFGVVRRSSTSRSTDSSKKERSRGE